MTDSRSGEKSLRELEFNDLNIHTSDLTMEQFQNTWNIVHGNFMVLYDFFWWLSWGLTTTE